MKQNFTTKSGDDTLTIRLRYAYDTDVRFLDRLFKKQLCRRIIDIGCGTGNHAERLDSLGYEVTALGISPAMLKILERKVKGDRIRIKQGDMKKLAGARYDL